MPQPTNGHWIAMPSGRYRWLPTGVPDWVRDWIEDPERDASASEYTAAQVRAGVRSERGSRRDDGSAL